MSSLFGKRVLLVEDEYLLGADLEQALEAAGAVVVGPFASVREAEAALDQSLDLAVMNIKVRDGDTYPLAARLRDREVPIVFATGQDMRTEPVEWHSFSWITKPYTVDEVIELLGSALRTGDGARAPYRDLPPSRGGSQGDIAGSRRGVLADRTIFVVEDDYFLAQGLKAVFEKAGAKLVGPVASVNDALKLLSETGSLDGAVLDVNLNGEMVFPVADVLTKRSVPFVFATGYSTAHLPSGYRQVTCCTKPLDPETIAQLLFK